MPDNTFTIARFENRNGVISWRVSGWLAGIRVRRNFRTREEAAAEKATLEVRALQATNGIRQASTFLTDEELREAETAFRRLVGRPHRLSVYLDYALANYRDATREQTLDASTAAYVEAKHRDEAHGVVSARQLRSIRHELVNLRRHFPGSVLVQLTPANLTGYFERGHPAPKTYNNRRGIVGAFLRFAFQREWIVSNPLERVPHRRIAHRRGEAPTITATQATELMAHVEGFAGGILVPYFALCLFGGIRPSVTDGEIAKLRPERVRLDDGIIMVDAEASKVRMRRLVAIQPNLAAWLRAYPLDRFPIIPRNAKNYRRRICRAHGLTHDVLRHTFISMFVAKFRSMGEAALQAGNSESIIRKHYLDLKSKDEAEAFFSILPKLRTAPAAKPAPEPTPAPVPQEADAPKPIAFPAPAGREDLAATG
jgi:hypothetical protein